VTKATSTLSALHTYLHILPSTILLIWKHERNTIKLHVQLFLRMNTWMFKTCRRHYNQIKLLMQKVWILLVFITYVYQNTRFKKRKVYKQSPWHAKLFNSVRACHVRMYICSSDKSLIYIIPKSRTEKGMRLEMDTAVVERTS